MSAPAPIPAESGTAIRFPDRLLSEAARVFENFNGEAPVREADLEAIRSSGVPFEDRIVRRAQGLAARQPLTAALDGLASATRMAFLGGLVLAILSGAAAASGALGFGRNEEINVSVVVGALLVVQSLLLTIWLITTLFLGRTKGASSLGRGVVSIARRLFLRASDRHREGAVHHASAASAAFAEVVTRTSIGRWTFGTISNALWLAFNVAVLGTLVFLLSTRHYVFVWETTLLSDATFERIVRATSVLPAALGFDVPSSAIIQTTRWGAEASPGDEARIAWSGFLLGSITAYGLVPRALFLLICGMLTRVAKLRYRLNLDRTGFARLRTELLPSSRPLGVVDPDTASAPRQAPKPKPTDTERPLGAPAWIAIELDAPTAGWPPKIGGMTGPRPVDLGFVDDGNDRHRVLAAIAEARTEPSTLLVACALTTTPDRGIRAFLEDLRASVTTPLTLVLSEGQRLRKRTDAEGVGMRIEHWRRLAAEAGIDDKRVIELDLEHLGKTGAGALATLLGAEEAVLVGGLPNAFALIVEHTAKWSGPPSTEEEHALHRAISELYGAESRGTLTRLLRVPRLEDLGVDFSGGMEASARRALDLLPARLRQSPRWIAAGAVTGSALCLAAATAAGPLALAALPSWALVGGTIGALAKAMRKESSPAPEAPAAGDGRLGEAVRAATLTSLLYELAGEGEQKITSALDAALGAEVELASAAAVGPWLEEVRHRLDLARAEFGR